MSPSFFELIWNKELLDSFLNKEEKAIEKAILSSKKIMCDIKKYDLTKNDKQKKLIGKNCKNLFFSIIREMYDVAYDLNKYDFLETELMPVFITLEEILSEKGLIKAEDYINKDGNTETWLPGYERYWEECDDEE